MKRSEKLFMLINEIDEQIINEAKPEAEKPVAVKIDRRSSAKWFIALAACVAALAVGIFALVKFKTDGVEPAPFDNSSNDSSDIVDSDNSNMESSAQSVDNSSKIELALTKQDIELQAILKDLIASATDIDGIFTRLSEQGEEYREVTNVEYNGTNYTYYPIADGRRTEPSGLFTIPQTRSELEALLLTCFTRRAAANYMTDTGTGQMMVTDFQEHNAVIDDFSYKINTVIEIDGRLFHRLQWQEYRLDIDYTTAQVRSKTEKTIRFTYFDSSGDPGETDGIIMLENGGWKLDYFHTEKFIPDLPTEFTEEDMELQNILNELSAAQTIFCWVDHGAMLSDEYKRFKFKASDGYVEEYELLPKDKKAPNGLEYPQSREEVEDLLLKYFTQNTVDKFMKRVDKGTLIENPDGTYNITTANTHEFAKYDMYPIFVEIDGNMYLRHVSKGGPGTPIWYTAQITERTSDSIKFTIVLTAFSECFIDNGLIKFERGGWKLSYGFGGFDPDNSSAA